MLRKESNQGAHIKTESVTVIVADLEFYRRWSDIFIYPENLKAKATLWLWELRDVAIIGIGLLLSILALSQTGLMIPLVITALYAFLSIRVDESNILDFLRYAVCFLFLKQQYFEWKGSDR